MRSGWTVNPRGNLWFRDSGKYGQKMLEKMGWTEGKGLGKNEDGILENIRVTHKNDNKGLGFVSRDHDWIAYQDNFNTLLASLKFHDINDSQSEVKTQNLEKRAKGSKRRVRYHRFIRGKDLSRCTPEDMTCIFPSLSGKLTELKTSEDNCFKAVSAEKSDAAQKHTLGITTFTSQYTAEEYFSKKMKERKTCSSLRRESENQEPAAGKQHEVLSNGSWLQRRSNKKRKLQCNQNSSLEIDLCRQDQQWEDSFGHHLPFDSEVQSRSFPSESKQTCYSEVTSVANCAVGCCHEGVCNSEHLAGTISDKNNNAKKTKCKISSVDHVTACRYGQTVIEMTAKANQNSGSSPLQDSARLTECPLLFNKSNVFEYTTESRCKNVKHYTNINSGTDSVEAYRETDEYATKINKRKRKHAESSMRKCGGIDENVHQDRKQENSASCSLEDATITRKGKETCRGLQTRVVCIADDSVCGCTHQNGSDVARAQMKVINSDCIELGSHIIGPHSTKLSKANSETQDIPKQEPTGMQEIIKELASPTTSWSNLKRKAVAYDLFVANIKYNTVLKTSNLMKIKGYGNK